MIFIGGAAFSISHAIIPRAEGENIKHLATVTSLIRTLFHFVLLPRSISLISIGFQSSGLSSVSSISFIINDYSIFILRKFKLFYKNNLISNILRHDRLFRKKIVRLSFIDQLEDERSIPKAHIR